MPLNIYHEYRRCHEAGNHPDHFESFRGGLERGAREGYPRSWEDAYRLGYTGMEYGRGYGDIFPHTESWGYEDMYGMFDEWNAGRYDDCYGGGYGGYGHRYPY
jgi:hypothetical protein